MSGSPARSYAAPCVRTSSSPKTWRARCPAYAAPICSLCCLLESRRHDRCVTGLRATDQLRNVVMALLPQRWASKMNFRLGQYLMVMVSLCAVMAFLVVVACRRACKPRRPSRCCRCHSSRCFFAGTAGRRVCMVVVPSTDSRLHGTR